MSVYSTVDGMIRCDDKESFRQTVQALQDIGMQNNIYLNPSREADSEDEESKWVVDLVYGHYRNVARHIDDVLEAADGGGIVGTCSDGQFTGFVELANDDTSIDHDLHDWVEENNSTLADSEPQTEDFDTEDDWFDAHVDWQTEVEQEYIGVFTEKFKIYQLETTAQSEVAA